MPFSSNYHFMFYDGDCLLCNRAIRTILAKDKSGHIRAVPLQILNQVGLELENAPSEDIEEMNTIYLWSNGNWYAKSSAIIRLYEISGRRFKANFLSIFPKTIRDFMYDFVARNRQKLNQILKRCPMVSRELRQKCLMTVEELNPYFKVKHTRE